MKRLFALGVVLGFCGVVAGAYLYPWVEHERIVTQTAVINNGGRQERFVIRLPTDRITTLGGGLMGIRAAAYPPNLGLPVEFLGQNILIEQFKLRDAIGVVIGFASRHTISTSTGPQIAWALIIPGRGSLMLTATGEQAGAIDERLQFAGYTGASSWTGDVRVALVGEHTLTRTVAGTQEFAELNTTFNEVWAISGVDDTGALRGTIELDTITLSDFGQ